jgi:hypothetical protein
MKTVYKLRFIPLAISLPTLLVVLVLKFYLQLPLDGVLKFSIFLVVISLLFLHTMRDWKKNYEGKSPEVIKEIPVFENVDDPGVIKRLANGSSLLIFEWFPFDGPIDEETLTVDMAAAIGAKVYRDDRERFIIASNEEGVIDKAVTFLRAARTKP